MLCADQVFPLFVVLYKKNNFNLKETNNKDDTGPGQASMMRIKSYINIFPNRSSGVFFPPFTLIHTVTAIQELLNLREPSNPNPANSSTKYAGISNCSPAR